MTIENENKLTVKYPVCIAHSFDEPKGVAIVFNITAKDYVELVEMIARHYIISHKQYDNFVCKKKEVSFDNPMMYAIFIQEYEMWELVDFGDDEKKLIEKYGDYVNITPIYKIVIRSLNDLSRFVSSFIEEGE